MKSGQIYRGTVSLAKFFKMATRSSDKFELRVNSADIEVGENDQIINGHSFFLLISTINISVLFLCRIGLYIIRISG